MWVRLFPNKDQTNVLAVPTNPINICSSPVSDINTTDHSPDMQPNSLQMTHTASQPTGWRLEGEGGSSVSTDAFQGRQGDEESGSGNSQTRKELHLSRGPIACERAGPHAGARDLVLMQRRKEKEFVFMAIYRQDGNCDIAAAPRRAVTH